MGRNRNLGTTGKQGVAVGGRTLHLPQNTNLPPSTPVAGYTCVMSSEPNGGKLTWRFNPDPVQVLWGLSATIQVNQTRGGQVTYSNGRTIGPLTIVGYVRSRWALLAMSRFVAAHQRESQRQGKSLRFIYPERMIDYSLDIESMSEIGLDGNVGEISAFSLVCQISQDHTSLEEANISRLVPNLPENIEWIDVENAAKIAEERFGETLGISGGEEEDDGGDKQEGQDGKEDKPAEEKDPFDTTAGSGKNNPPRDISKQYPRRSSGGFSLLDWLLSGDRDRTDSGSFLGGSGK